MAGKLEGRVAVVIGGSKGIGSSIAVALAAQGALVALTYSSSPAKAHEVVAKIEQQQQRKGRAVAIKCDVSIEEDVKALFDAAEGLGAETKKSKVSILINCAGVLQASYPSVAETSLAEWEAAAAVNARGSFLACREGARRMADGGRMVNFSSSTVGSYPPGYGAYVASKAAVEGMSKVLAKELGGRRITVNCVAPGAVATDLFFAGKTEAMVQAVANSCPLGRIGEVADVVPVVLFLVSDDAGWVNGQVLRVNGDMVV